MTFDNRTSERPVDLRALRWLTALAGLLAVVAAAILALAGHAEAAAAVGVTGGAVLGGGQVTVHIHR